MYKEYQPGNLLSPYVDKYWEFKGCPYRGMQLSVLPDGCTDVIFTLGEAVNPLNDGRVMQPYRTYFVGPMTAYSDLVAYADHVHMLGIRFLPCGIFRFTELPLRELLNQRVRTEEVELIFKDAFAENLGDCRSVQDRIRLIECFLLNCMRKTDRKIDRQVRYAVGEINRYNGKLTIQTLVRELWVGQRHLERQFKQYTGFTPKEYSRIIKFRNAVNLLKTIPSEDLLTVALEAGYYDVPHLSREIKRLSGSTPSSFLSFLPEENVALIYKKF